MELRLPKDVRGELAELLGERPQAIAWATGNELLAVGLRQCLAFRRGDEWRRVGYHEVERGTWVKDDSTLRIETIDGERVELTLDSPGKLPELFRERVDATILAERVVGEGARQVRIVGRRDLADEQIYWHVSAIGGGDLEDPGVLAAIDEGVRGLRADYGLGG